MKMRNNFGEKSIRDSRLTERIDLDRKIYIREKVTDDLTFRVLSTFVFVLPLFVIPGVFYYIPLAKAVLLKAVASILLIAWAYYIVTTRRLRWHSTPLDLPVFLFAAVIIVASLLAFNPLTSIVGSWSERFEELPSWIAYLVLLIAAINYQGKFKRIATICKALVAGSVVVSLYGIFQRFGYDFTRFAWTQELRSSATMGNPIILGAYLVMVVPVALGLMLSSRFKEEKVFWGISAAVAGLTTIFTGSRGAWLGSLAGLAVFLLLLAWKGYASRHRRELVVLGAAFLLIIFVSLYAGGVLGGAASPVKRANAALVGGGSIATRLSIWRSSLRMIADRPLLGWGFENFRDFFGMYREERHAVLTQGRVIADRPHNQILYLAFAAGPLAVLIFIWMVLVFARAVLRILKDRAEKSGEETLLLIGLVASVFAYLVQEEFSFSVPAVTPIFWLILGFGLNPALHGQTTNRSRRSITTRIAWLLSATALVLSLILIIPSGLSLAADYYYYQGLGRVSTEGELPAIDSYKQAIRLNPLKGQYRLSLSRAYRRLAYDTDNPVWLRRALPVLNKGIELEPASPDLYFALAEIYYAGSDLAGISDYTLAKRWALAGLRRLPQSEDGRIILAESLIGEGRYDQALEELVAVLNRAPLETRGLVAAGKAMLGKGDMDTAALFFKRALQINPGYSEARRLLSQIQ